MSPLGDPLARQPRGSPGGAQDCSMSSLQSNRTPDIQPVPCSSTDHRPLPKYRAVRSGCGHTAAGPSGNKQGLFHTGHLCGSCSYTVTDGLGGSTNLPWKSSRWTKKSPSPRDSNGREGHLPPAQMARKTKTPSLQGSEGVSLFAIGNQEELCLTADSDPEDQAWNLESQHEYLPISHLILTDSPSAALESEFVFTEVGKFSQKNI